MEIKIIGVGTMGNTQKNNTSILFDNMLLDCGMGTIKNLERQGCSVKDIKILLITHYHADHFFDIPNLIIGRKIRNEIFEKLTIIGPSDIKDKVEAMMKFSFNKNHELKKYANIEFISMNSQDVINVGDYKITAYDMLHGECKPNFGYVVDKDGLIISFTGDTTLCDNLYTMCKTSNLIFIDSTKFDDITKEHLSYNEVVKIASCYENCAFYPIHRGDYDNLICEDNNIKIVNDGDKILI